MQTFQSTTVDSNLHPRKTIETPEPLHEICWILRAQNHLYVKKIPENNLNLHYGALQLFCKATELLFFSKLKGNINNYHSQNKPCKGFAAEHGERFGSSYKTWVSFS